MARRPPLRIAVLLDPEIEFAELQDRDGPITSWFHADVVEGLKGLGHQIRLVHNDDDVSQTIDDLRTSPIDLIFNLTLHVAGRDEWAMLVPALLDMLRIPYTGADATGHALANDKGHSKRILRDAGVAVPHFFVPGAVNDAEAITFFPVLVKGLSAGGSTGLTKASLARTQVTAEREVSRLRRVHGLDAICEEYIEGIEVSVSLLERGHKLIALPICEWIFDSPGLTFITERAKWDSAYRAASGLTYRRAQLRPQVEAAAIRVAKRVFRLLHLRDYGRVDMRIDAAGRVVVHDVNPNFGLRPVSAEMRSMVFAEVIETIVRSAHLRSLRTG